MSRVYIDSDQIVSIANELKSKSANIVSNYRGDCYSVLKMSADCIQLSGVQPAEFFDALEKIYTQLDEKIQEFSSFLINVVASNYDFIIDAIINNFNNDIGLQLSSLLGVGMLVTGASGTVTSITNSDNVSETKNENAEQKDFTSSEENATVDATNSVNIKESSTLMGKQTINDDSVMEDLTPTYYQESNDATFVNNPVETSSLSSSTNIRESRDPNIRFVAVN